MTPAMSTPGVSSSARFSEAAARRELRPLQESNSFGLDSALREDLEAVWGECRNDNWDGYGALAVNQDTLRNTYLLLESLPFRFPPPSVGAEPDGHLTLEWHRAPRRTISVSVTPDDELVYAALLGTASEHGTMPFLGVIPTAIVELIRRIYSA